MSKTLPDIKTQFPEWYQEVIYQAELADQSPVRGSVVIRPYGFAIWENIRDTLDQRIKETGHQNASFPLLIPLSFLQKEAEHVEGFAPELAIVTHAGGKELEEPYVIRPTSETIIHYMFAKWIKSWRDLPLKINQWANVVRWEMRTRPFLRTSEFFWQEGHTAHETAEEAEHEATMMWREYIDLYENYLAIPVVSGLKSESEKFAGADKTYTVESLMQDGKALQMCTSHLISQAFAKSFDMVFQDREGKLAYPYLTSWGLTTRSVGAVVMVHGDQKGLVLPPKAAPIQVIIIPIYKKESDKEKVLNIAENIAMSLKSFVRVEIDANEHETPGAKFYKWELKGVPLRLELGPRDIEAGQVIIADRLGLSKEAVSFDKVNDYIKIKLEELHQAMYQRALDRLKSQWYKVEKLNEFADDLTQKGGFYQTGWCGSAECEKQLKDYKATIRCLLDETSFISCFNCDQKSKADILIARAY
ncbi:MAG: proline--tRNA ligase [Candidatus Babeliales bacterium]